MRTRNILIVDDDASLRRSLSEILRVKGYAPTAAGTGKEALSKVEEEKPAVALIDLNLGDMSGLEVMREIRERSSGTECIVLTGHATQASAIEAVNLGAYSYVQKPYDVDGLLVTIRRAIEKRDAEEELRRHRDHLDELVREHTAELETANEQLRQEITERRRAEEARKAAERELEEQSVLSINSDRLRSLGEMAAGIAHELNQPLVGVRGLAEHLLIAKDRGWNLTDDRIRDKLRLIVEQADRMTHIIEHVRTFAREAGRPEKRPVQVNEVVQSAVGMLGAQFRSRGIDLRCELAEDLPVVSANPFSLEEVVLNLLLNARDAMEEKAQSTSESVSPQVLLRTSVGPDGSGAWVKIEVIDRGVGISQQLLPQVFDPFFTTKGPDRGTGLGLSVSRSIVEQFGGTLQIHSASGQGTTATVSLPTGDGGGS